MRAGYPCSSIMLVASDFRIYVYYRGSPFPSFLPSRNKSISNGGFRRRHEQQQFQMVPRRSRNPKNTKREVLWRELYALRSPYRVRKPENDSGSSQEAIQGRWFKHACLTPEQHVSSAGSKVPRATLANTLPSASGDPAWRPKGPYRDSGSERSYIICM